MTLKLNKKLIVAIFILIILIFHLIILSIDLQKNRSSILQRNNHTNKTFFLLIVQSSQILTFKQFQQFIEELSEYNIQIKNNKISVSISQKPKWQPIKNLKAYFTNILSDENNSLAISYQLKNGLWLNYKESNVENYYDTAVILSATEFILLGLIIFYIFSLRRFTVPLQKIKQSADRLGIDLNTQPLSEYGPSLVREAINAMNQMQMRIQSLIDNRTRMLAAISHDLRTPITRLKLRAHLINEEQHANKMIADLDEMENMIESILTFTSENDEQKRKIMFDINSLLASICDDYSDAGHLIHVRLFEQRIPFFGNPLALKRSFNNLIQNAIKYSNKIYVRLEKYQNIICIFIEDDGPGIPENELKKVFEPYYRSKLSTMVKSSTGTGLGLTIANEIISAHHGKIELKNKIGGGLLVIINLPILDF